MQDALLLSRVDLEALLDPESVIDAVVEALRAEQRGFWNTPKRIAARTEAGSLLAMPCGGGVPEALGAKLVSTFPGNSERGLPGVSGLYALFDPSTGVPLAVMDGAYLTLVRTAAVSAVATRLLARPEARTLGLFGAGAQARFHAMYAARVRPIDAVVVWARRREKAESLLAELEGSGDLPRVSSFRVAGRPEEAAECDVVVTATASIEPVLLGRWLRAGAHVNAIGTHTKDSREVDAEVVTRAQTLAVETGQTLEEAGDLQMAEQEKGGVLSRVVTLGALLDRSSAPATSDPRAITLFKSCGVAFEDLAVAALALRRALATSRGVRFAFSGPPM